MLKVTVWGLAFSVSEAIQTIRKNIISVLQVLQSISKSTAVLHGVANLDAEICLSFTGRTEDRRKENDLI